MVDDDIAEEVADDVTDELVRSKRYVLAGGKKVHDAGMQTGVLGGRKVKQPERKKKEGQTLGEATGRMKVMMPLVEAMSVRPHLRSLLLNHAVLAAYKAGDTVLVKRGTRVVEVSESRLMAERAVLEAGNLHQPNRLNRALEKMQE